MPHTPHRVAVVVFCEADGTDAADAAAAARMAVSHALRQAAQTGPEAQAKVGSSRRPRCQRCGASAGTDDATDTIRQHTPGEPFYPDPDPEDPSWRPQVCPGAGLPPAPDQQPVVGYVRGGRLPVYARVHDVMEAGMALGNGYLWAGVTNKAFGS